MTGWLWPIAVAVLVPLLLVAASAVDSAADRRPPARIGQTVRKTPPPLPQGGWEPAFLLHRARRVRATRARYRYPEEL